MSNTNRTQPKKISRVLYFHNKTSRVVRVVDAGKDVARVRHHEENFTVPIGELFTATKEECFAYLDKWMANEVK